MRSLPFHVRYLSLANGISVACFIAGFIFSWRAVSSISTAMMILTGLVATTAQERKASWPVPLQWLMSASFLNFLAECTAAILHPPADQHFHSLQIRSALVFIPIACYASFPVMQAGKMHFIRIFCGLLGTAALYCLFIQWWKGQGSALTDPFLYHALVSPLGQHAVLFSFYLFFAVILLTEDLLSKKILFPFWAATGLLLFFCVFIFLLSSKLVILLCLTYFCSKLIGRTGVSGKFRNAIFTSVILAGALVILTPNGIHRRFRELVTGNFSLLQQDSYSPAIYFNAWEFRLLQFRIVPRILREDAAWLTGTGPGRAQALLDEQYTKLQMYQGDPGSGKKGYLGYHTHDQWLQSALEAGLPGLLAFAFMTGSLILCCLRQRTISFTFPGISLIAFSFTDAPLASQYGIVLFLFFLHFFWNKPGTPS